MEGRRSMGAAGRMFGEGRGGRAAAMLSRRLSRPAHPHTHTALFPCHTVHVATAATPHASSMRCAGCWLRCALCARAPSVYPPNTHTQHTHSPPASSTSHSPSLAKMYWNTSSPLLAGTTSNSSTVAS